MQGNSINPANGEGRNRTGSDRGNDLAPSRRHLLSAGGATVLTALAGCTDVLGTAPDRSDSEEVDGPEPPWTTEALAEKAQQEGQTSINLYTAAGEPETWRTWESVIQEEYSWFEIDTLVTGRGEEVTQRVVQEYQADQVTVDVAGEVPSLLDDINLVREIFERDYQSEYTIAEEYPDAYTNIFISTQNRGPSLSLPYNTELVDELGLDVPQSYNDFLDDSQYQGMDMLIVQDPNMKRFGWIVNYHAEQKGMSALDWLSEIADTIDFTVGSGHTQVGRFLGTGKVAPMMFYSYPWTVNKSELAGLPVTNQYVDNIPYFLSSGILGEVNGAPNPWGARFFLSVALEPFLQKALASEIPTFTPERQDVDYSNLDMAEDIEERVSLFGNMDNIPFEEEQELKEIGSQAFSEVFGTPEIDVN